MNENLQNETEKRLKISIDDADYLRNDIFKKLEKIDGLHKKFNFEIDLKSFKKIINYRLFLNLLISDISAAILFYINSKSKYEKIYSVRLIIVCINEGYKKIYHFVNTNKNGKIDTKNRESSFWIKDIKKIIENETPKLEIEYESITNLLDLFWDDTLNNFQDTRNLSIHYDFELTKVYDEIVKISPEETFQKLIPFLNILHRMFDLTMILTENLLSNSKIKNNEMREKTNESIDNVLHLIKKSNIDKNDEMSNFLQNIKKQINN